MSCTKCGAGEIRMVMMSERGFASTIAPLGTTREALLMLGRLKVPAKVIDMAAELEYTHGRGSISLHFWFQHPQCSRKVSLFLSRTDVNIQHRSAKGKSWLCKSYHFAENQDYNRTRYQ